MYYSVSKNPNITLAIVNQHSDKQWNYIELIENESFTFYEMLNDSNWKEYKPCISCNPNITWQIVLDNSTIKWNYYVLSYNANINWDIIQANHK